MMKAKQWISIFLLAACLCAFAAAGMAAGQLVLPENLTEIKAEAFEGNTSLDEVVLPEGIETIGSRAFADSSISSINLPSSITYIADDAFEGRENLQMTAQEGSYAYDWTVKKGYYVQMPATPVSSFWYVIENGAVTINSFFGNETDVVVPPQIEGYEVTSIGSSAFTNSNNVTSVTLPDSVKSIGDAAFYGCRNLRSIVLPNSVKSIGENAFYGCRSLKSITLPNAITSIKQGTFIKCVSLSSITVPNNVTSIGGYAFSECSSLMDIKLPDKLKSIGESTFFNCDSLVRIILPNTVKTIGDYAFNNCDKLMQIELPNDLTRIGISAFLGCNRIEAIQIPSSVTSIGYDAFAYCSDDLIIYGTAGSYVEAYAIDNGITFIAGEMPNVFPTYTDFTLNAAPTELTIPVGGQLVFGGTVNAGSAPLTAVQASIFDAADPEKGVECAREENLSADTFDLSTFSPIKVGETYVGEEQSLTMEAGKDYVVMIYAADESGNGFEDHDPDTEGPQGPSILVHVVAPGETTWYANVADEAGNTLTSVTLPYTGEYAGNICVRTNNGNMTAWVADGFPFELALETVELQADGSYLFTYAISAPLDMTGMEKTDTILFCLRDENGVAITDAPLAQLTVTQEANVDLPVIYSIVDSEGNDLTKTPLTLDYTGKSATSVIVKSNTKAITAWFNVNTSIDFGAPEETLLEDGTYQLVYRNVKANENVTASDIARTCVFYAYTTDAAQPDKSRTLAEMKVVQEGNPNIPIVKKAWVTHGDRTYDVNGPLQLVVGDHNYYDGYTLNVEVSNGVSANWTVYTDNTQVATTYRTKDGKLYVHAKAEGTTALYISHIYTEDFATLREEEKHLVCYIRVETPYHAIVIADPTYRDYYTDSTKTQTAQGIVRRDLDSNRMIDLFESLSFDNETSINKVATPYPRESKSYDGPTTVAQLRGSCNMISQKTSENSVTFVYILCHGSLDGSLVFGLDNHAVVSPAQLKEMLDPIKGKIVLFLGSCFSGSMIVDQPHDWVYTWTEKVQIPIIGEWEKENKEEVHVSQGVFTTDAKYHVITAANYDKSGKSPYDNTSFTLDSDGRAIIGESVGNLFTTGICSSMAGTAMGTRTLEEVYTMANRYVTAYEGISDYPPQEMQRYPENDSMIIFQKTE